MRRASSGWLADCKRPDVIQSAGVITLSIRVLLPNYLMTCLYCVQPPKRTRKFTSRILYPVDAIDLARNDIGNRPSVGRCLGRSHATVAAASDAARNGAATTGSRDSAALDERSYYSL